MEWLQRNLRSSNQGLADHRPHAEPSRSNRRTSCLIDHGTNPRPASRIHSRHKSGHRLRLFVAPIRNRPTAGFELTRRLHVLGLQHWVALGRQMQLQQATLARARAAQGATAPNRCGLRGCGLMS